MTKAILTTALTILLAVCTVVTRAQTDSTATGKCTTFHTNQLIVPTVLITAGWFGVHNNWCHQLSNDIRQEVEKLSGSRYWNGDNYLQYAPLAAHLTLDYAGVKAQNPMRERMATAVTATVLFAAISGTMKQTISERRPDSEACNSFPSGHTGIAFMGAELVRKEYGTTAGIGAYLFATSIGFLRLYNNRHWLNDIVGGAGVGILSARLAYWLLPVERRWLGWDNKKSGASIAVMPTYDTTNRAAGFALTATF